MEDARSPLNWECDYQEEAHEAAELKLSQFYSKLEMETRIAYANEEIARKSDDVSHLKSLLTKTIKERDEFRFICQRLVSENLILQQEIQKIEANLSSFVRATHTSYIDEDPIAQVVSSLVSNENYAKTQLNDQVQRLSLPASSSSPNVIDNMVLTKRLPEKGRFLHAMMEAGPLLQNLLLVGHIPRWRNPPPQLGSIKIPQTTSLSSYMVVQDDDFPPTTNNENQKVVHQSPSPSCD